MKITKKHLQEVIKEEIKKLLLEYEGTTLHADPESRHAKKAAYFGEPPLKTARSGLAAKGHASVLEETLKRLSRIEGKIDEAAGRAPMSTQS
jgi:hypothetical protein